MQTETAINVLRALADGVDPVTGEVMPSDSPYQQADTVRALYAALAALDKQERSDERRRRLPINAGRAWNADEDAELGRAFDNGESVQAIAGAHGRTPSAIHSRLVKLGRLSE